MLSVLFGLVSLLFRLFACIAFLFPFTGHSADQPELPPFLFTIHDFIHPGKGLLVSCEIHLIIEVFLIAIDCFFGDYDDSVS